MTQGERVRMIRKHPNVNLTLEKFGEKLGIKKSALSLIENGKNNLTEQMAKSICREFRVNYFWLTGEKGEPFINIPDTALDDLADDYDLDNIDKKIIQKYLELSADQRDVIKAYLRSLCEDEKSGDSPVFSDEVLMYVLKSGDPDYQPSCSQDDLRKELGF